MTRIFLTLATINALLLLTAFALGLEYMAERNANPGLVPPQGYQPIGQGGFAWHMIVGLVTAVFTLLVHCLIFTYFLGTGRWVKEVAIAYQIPDEPLPKLTREFKRSAYPAALFAMLSTVAAVASGAGAQTAPESWWGWSHVFFPVLAVLLNAYAYVIEYRAITANTTVMEKVMDLVEARRAAVAQA